jgi:hypothetical protein
VRCHLLLWLAVLAVFATVSLSARPCFALVTYLSQAGDMGVSGSHDRLGSDSDARPISGTTEVNQMLSVTDSSPPSSYAAAAELHTRLRGDRIVLDAWTSAEATNCNDLVLCSAKSDVDLAIVFELDTAAVGVLNHPSIPGAHNGPVAQLAHTTLGFILAVGPDFGAAGIRSCGSLPANECFDFAYAFGGPGALFPAGEYELIFNRSSAMAKSAAPDAGTYMSDRSVQLHGGVGFTWECDVHLYFKRRCTTSCSTRRGAPAALARGRDDRSDRRGEYRVDRVTSVARATTGSSRCLFSIFIRLAQRATFRTEPLWSVRDLPLGARFDEIGSCRGL